MTTSTRLRGNAKPVFTLKLGAGSATSYADDVKKWELSFDDKDDSDLTFAEAAAGLLKDATLKLTAVFSFDAGSLAAFLWDNAGQDLVVDFGPWGNATATATKPHFTGTAATDGPYGFSNEAKSPKDVTGAEFEVELKFSTALTKVTS